jgi:ribosome-associated toxin RatA of RatAB toxin-antitoxin module
MKTITRTIEIHRPAEVIFALLSDVRNYRLFFAGITRWEPLSDNMEDMRIKVLMRLGSVATGGTIRIESVEADRLIHWRSETGIHQSGSWHLQPTKTGTLVTLSIGFDLQGGLAGRLVEYFAARTMGRYMDATLLAMRRIVEREIITGDLGESGDA